MMLCELNCNQGLDGMVYFWTCENMDYRDWSRTKAPIVTLRDAKVKVVVDCFDFTWRDAEKLLYAYLRGRNDGSLHTYRLD